MTSRSLAFALLLATTPAFADPLPSVGTVAHLGQRDGVAVDVVVQGPTGQITPLQVACVFEYQDGDLTTPPALPAALNGMRHLDDALGGLVTELRKTGRFAGHRLETLLVTPKKGTLAGERLLLVGLGDRKTFSPAVLHDVGVVEVREALALGVTAYAHASDVKDAGVDSPASADAVAVIRGALEGLATQRLLAKRGLSPVPTLTSITLLSGPSFFAETKSAVGAALADHM